MSGKLPLRAMGLNPQAVPDRGTCLNMLVEISAEAFASPHFREAPDLTVRYWTVMHWLRHGTVMSAEEKEDLRSEPSIAAYIGMSAWEELLGSPGPGKVRP